ncbi:major facilitator superfamily protein [Stylonychia lemnae]|uniref:Major facilitator superfamily protein n=1 Tax=Stylonychia lemnae TaxID=5949 RepID=A0A078ADF4_STYLE|nr:major facilitator superfamily protein [Stylonychia lemnae]|eukprot:CDW80279.1 major facilitator superfamily protein [Stylonychia lemnae]
MKGEQSKQSKYENIWKAQQLALGFLVLFIAQSSALNLQSKVMNQNGFGPLGNYNLAVLSIFCVLGGFLSTTMIKRLGINITLVIGTIGIAQWILCSVLPALKNNEPDKHKRDTYVIYSDAFIYSIMIISSCICGMATGFVWTAQGVYTAECATVESKGFYFSCFWTTYTFSQVVGNLIAAFVLGSMDQSNYFYIMAGIAVSACLIFGTLRKPKKFDSNKSDHAATLLQFDSSNDSNILEEQLKLQQMKKNQQEQIQNQSIWENIKSVWACFIQKRMRLFLPENFWTGVSISYYTGMLVPIMTASISLTDDDSQSQFKKAMLAMVALGVGEMMGGQIIGLVVDKVNSKVACIVNLVIMIVMFAFTFGFLVDYRYTWLTFVMTFLWGLQDSAVNTHVFEMLGFEFDNNDDAFAIYSLIQSLASFIFQFSQSLVDTHEKYYIYTGVLAFIGVICIGITYFFDFKHLQKLK